MFAEDFNHICIHAYFTNIFHSNIIAKPNLVSISVRSQHETQTPHFTGLESNDS